MQGKFITFEGVDGGGKTTQIQLAAAWLRERGYEVLVSREPGGTVLAEKVRELVLDADLPLTNTTQTLLFLAARSEHMDKLLRPALAAGKIVLCDRFSDSTLVYQGLALGKSLADLDELRRLGDFATEGAKPDLTIVLDGEPAKLAARRAQRGVSDRFEQEGLPYQAKLRQGFLRLALAEPERMRVVNAEGSTEEVAAEIREVLQEVLREAE